MGKRKPEEIVEAILQFLMKHDRGSIRAIAAGSSIDRRTASRYLKLLEKVSLSFPVYEVPHWSGSARIFSLSAVPLFLPARPVNFDSFPAPRMVETIYRLCDIAARTGRVVKGSREVCKVVQRRRPKLVVVTPCYALGALITPYGNPNLLTAVSADERQKAAIDALRHFSHRMRHSLTAKIPGMCTNRKLPCAFVPDGAELGFALRIHSALSAAAIMDAGQGQALLDIIVQLDTSHGAGNPYEHVSYAPQFRGFWPRNIEMISERT